MKKSKKTTEQSNIPINIPININSQQTQTSNNKDVKLIRFDSLFEEIARDAVLSGQISTSYIQRNYDIGFNRAGRIMMQLESAGIVEKQKGASPRQILVCDLIQLEQILKRLDIDKVEYKKQIENEKIEHEKAEIAANIKEKYRRKNLEKIVLQELIDSGEIFDDQPKRPPIPREVVDAVYKRDGGRCVYCGSTENLQLDHIIPFSRGGATTLENLQLLCQKCNLEKSNKIG